MKIVFHESFKRTDYAADCASAPGRVECIMDALVSEGRYDVVSPGTASYNDLLRAHSPDHIASIAEDTKLFEMASLSAGGAILASEIAFEGEPTFACIRPPGHHASRNSRWDYCAFCNMGIALMKLKARGLIKSAFVLDFDAHTGDGNIDVLSEWKEARVMNPVSGNDKDYIKEIENYVRAIEYVDIVGVSAGFDSYTKDVGNKLTRFDFYQIGRLMKKFTKRMGHKRCFAILEGGYYLPDLGKNVLAFCQGFE